MGNSFWVCCNGTSDEEDDDESHESREGHESNEGHEDEAGVCHRQGSACSCSCFCWKKTKDYEWIDKRQAHEEQSRKNCVQITISCIKTSVRKWSRPMDKSCRCRSKGFRSDRLRCSQWQYCTGKGHLCQG